MSHSISRRSFFRIATASLMTLPTIANGFLVPHNVAHAEELPRGESFGGGADGVTERIVVVSASEVGFCVMDMADGGKSKVAGATVTVTSRYNGKSVQGMTDEDGIVVFDVKELSENPDGLDVNMLDEYAFNASILITCDGYRDCEIKLIRVEGATPLLVPTRSLTDGLPYPRSVGFNDWDVLYTANEFAQASGNTETHTLSIEWREVGSQEALVELRRRGEDTALLSTRATPKDRVLTASFSGKFLQTDASEALPTSTDFDVVVTQGENTYSVPIQLAATIAPADEPADEQEVTLTPLNTGTGSQTAIDAKWPGDIPLVSGGSLKSWSPDLPINVYLNPFGYFQVTLKSPSWGYKSDGGSTDNTQWGTFPRKSASAQFDKLLDTANKMSTATSNAFSADGNLNQIDFSKSVSVLVSFQALAAAQWKTDKGLFQGMLGGQMCLACDLSISENFFAGPIPVLITFSISLSATISLNCGIYSLQDKSNPDEKFLDAAFDFSRWKFDYANTGLTVTLNITPSLSVGVGIRGVASISVMGRFTLTMYSGFTYRGELDEETHPLPHRIFGFSAQIGLVLHMFLFTKTFALKDWKYRDFYDDWKGGLQPMADELAGDALWALANESLTSMMGQMDIITNDMLLDTCEYEGTLAGQSDDANAPTDGPAETFDWETMRRDDITASLADGTTITYAVYDLFVHDEPTDGNLEGQAEGAPDNRLRPSLGSSVAYRPLRVAEPALGPLADNPTSVLPDPIVQELGREGGIRPSSDLIIAPKVFGDPRVKVVNISLLPPATGDDYIRATCSFRIASVLVDGQPRTRIVITFLGVSGEGLDDYPSFRDLVGTSKVLDFDIDDVPGVSHKGLYDYDFDLVFTTHTERQFDPMWGEWREYTYERIHLVIVSGARSSGDQTSIASAATDLVFTYLCFETKTIDIDPIPLFSRRSIRGSEVLGNDGLFHCISSLQCVADSDEDSSVLVVGFLDRMSATEAGVLSDDPGTVSVKPALLFVNVRANTMSIPSRSELDAKIGSIDNASAFELALSPKIGGYYTLSVRGPQRTHFFVLEVDSNEATLSNVWIGGVLDASVHLVAWKAMDCFLTSYPKAEYVQTLAENWQDPDTLDHAQWVLQTARWNTSMAVPSLAELVFEPVGPTGFNFSNFGINSAGTYIFWPQGKDGDDGRVYDQDGNYEPNEDVPVYQIMACRYRNGKFCDPFVAADVSHDMSSMEIVTTRSTKAPLEVLSNELVDPADDEVYYASNLWYTSVPNVRSATAVGCECPVPLVSPGGTTRFNVTIRNDGNTYLCGCTLQLCLHENGEVLEVEGSAKAIAFDEETLQPSNWNPVNDDGSLQNVEDDWSLAPGKLGVYRVDVPIPGDWEGEKFVSFVAIKPEMPDDGGLNSLADDAEEVEYVDFSVKPGSYKVNAYRTSLDQEQDRTHMQVIAVGDSVASGTTYADAPVRTQGTADTQPEHGESTPTSGGATTNTPASPAPTTGTSTSSGTASGGSLVRTGDPGLGALSAGFALAGAALVAYGKRRAANETAAHGQDHVARNSDDKGADSE